MAQKIFLSQITTSVTNDSDTGIFQYDCFGNQYLPPSIPPIPPRPWTPAGIQYAYHFGGSMNPPTGCCVQKFDMTTDTNSVGVANITAGEGSRGAKSCIAGYARAASATAFCKMPFATDTFSSLSVPGGLTPTYTTGHGDGDYVYWAGGSAVLERFPVASEDAYTCIGNFGVGPLGTPVRARSAGATSDTNGYSAGGLTPPVVNSICKFSLASTASISCSGALTHASRDVVGTSSSTDGYATSGYPANARHDKYPFASDANATCVGTLGYNAYGGTGHETETIGFHAGGTPSPSPACGFQTTISSFPFATDTFSIKTGYLLRGGRHAGGFNDH